MRLMRIILGFALLMTPAVAAPLSAEQEKAVEQLIADYFIRNPDKMRDALSAYQAHMQAEEERLFAETMRDRAPALYRNEKDFSMGPADAPITIVEFFDYNCGYCKKVFAPLMEVLEENPDVRLVFKEFPILSQDSDRAARTALALDDKLKFLTFHTKLMTHRGSINGALLDKTLTELKLDKAALARKARSEEVDAHINETKSLARDLGITGTPAFVIDGQLYPGALEKDRLNELIAMVRANQKAKN